ncbi:hypothetical protein [Streptomyces sp. NPDC005533]|uniref:hypothetical protein n=1 Tax=Streptomyces sp. NPDC005533 TaxID=3364723 RepID=UPI00368F06E1
MADEPSGALCQALLWTLAAGLGASGLAMFIGGLRSGRRWTALMAGCMVTTAVSGMGVAAMSCSAGCPSPLPTVAELVPIVSAVILFAPVITVMLVVGWSSPDRLLRAVSMGTLAMTGLGAVAAATTGPTAHGGLHGGTFPQVMIVAALSWFLVLIARSAPTAPTMGASLAWTSVLFTVAAAAWWQPSWPMLKTWHTAVTVVVLMLLVLIELVGGSPAGEAPILPTVCDLCRRVIPLGDGLCSRVRDSSWADPVDPRYDGRRLIIVCDTGHLAKLQEQFRQRPFVNEELWAAKINRAHLRHQGTLGMNQLAEETGLVLHQIEAAALWAVR